MWRNRRLDTVRFATMIVLLTACFLFGGASRSDVASLLMLQPLAVLCALAFVLTPGVIEWSTVRNPLLLLGAFAGIIAAQLIPLPPAVWTQLPGHEAFAQSAMAAGLEQPWRPVSLTPDLTLASLVGLVVPAAVIVGMGSLSADRRQAVLVILLFGVAASVLFGLAQISGGSQSSFYTYRITNEGVAVGLFANRNHEAALLALAWPLLAAWASIGHRDRRRRTAGRWIALGAAIFIVPMLLITGSRSGLILGVIGLIAAVMLWWRSGGTGGRLTRFERITLVGAGVVAVAIFAAAIVLSRAASLERFFTTGEEVETRIAVTPTLLTIARDFFPVGSGFGSFDPIFRVYEPSDFLSPQYLNHAHNDVLELIITGGLPAVLIASAFVGWSMLRAVNVWRSTASSPAVKLARAGSAVLLILAVASVVDYPLRTPLMMAVMAIACSWLAAGGSATTDSALDE